MTDDLLQHTHLDGIADYSNALDTLCKRARHKLYLFEKDFDGLGFNSATRYETLRHFLLANSANCLFVLTHNTHYLTTQCARMGMLLRQFDNRLSIHQTDKQLSHLTAPFSVADDAHYVRRFHFDDPRGLLALNDPEIARNLEAKFLEMWSHSQPAIAATKLGL